MADDCFADEKSREHIAFSPATEDERPIEPISDIGIDRINSLMFGDRWFPPVEYEFTMERRIGNRCKREGRFPCQLNFVACICYWEARRTRFQTVVLIRSGILYLAVIDDYSKMECEFTTECQIGRREEIIHIVKWTFILPSSITDKGIRSLSFSFHVKGRPVTGFFLCCVVMWCVLW